MSESNLLILSNITKDDDYEINIKNRGRLIIRLKDLGIAIDDKDLRTRHQFATAKRYQQVTYELKWFMRTLTFLDMQGLEFDTLQDFFSYLLNKIPTAVFIYIDISALRFNTDLAIKMNRIKLTQKFNNTISQVRMYLQRALALKVFRYDDHQGQLIDVPILILETSRFRDPGYPSDVLGYIPRRLV